MDSPEPAEQPTPPTGPEPHAESAEPDTRDVRALTRDVSGLVARVDQLDAEVHAIDITIVLLAFALGALAGLVYLQARDLKELTG